ncbi:MAG: phosphoglycerate mutase [Labilithrix sp.]|nr:phosphoglycerate mutase [Labilithrix sp.]
MRRLFIARHGETAWNALQRLQGATDVPLNDVGRAQARAIGEALRGAGIVKVATSDLSRARETGEIAAAVLGLTVTTIDHELRERSFGVFEGLSRDELETRFPVEWRAWKENGIPPEGGEQPEVIVARMKRAIGRILEAGGPTLVVSHGAAMRLVLSDIGGRPVEPIPNGGLYQLDLENETLTAQPWLAPAKE